MAEESPAMPEIAEEIAIEVPGRLGRVLNWFARLSTITKSIITTVEFGLAIGCIWAAWTAGGDMYLIVPALTLGLFFGVVGIATIPEVKRRVKSSCMILTAFLFSGIGGFLYWHFKPPRTLDSAATLPAKKAVPSLDSTWSRAYYKCKWDGVMPDQKTIEKNTAAFKQYIGVYAETLSAIAMFPAIKGGDKAQLIPSAATGEAMGNFLEITFETRHLGKDLLGIFTARYKEDPYGAVSSQKMVPGSDLEVRIRKRIED
jgi:hypothetical protein